MTRADLPSEQQIAETMAGYFCPYFHELPADKLDRREKIRAGDQLAAQVDITQDDLLQAAKAVRALLLEKKDA